MSQRRFPRPMLAGALAAALVGALACAPAKTAGAPDGPAPKPNVDPTALERPDVVLLPETTLAVPTQARVAPPATAAERGWLPRASTGVPAFLQAHPTYDGRGVVIGILDSGIDLGTVGLDRTSTGEQKVLDLRDFSGEGRIALKRLQPKGDTLTVGSVRLAGASRVVGLGGGMLWGGTLAEIPLGSMPASDVNGDGDDADTLAVVVTRASDGWVLLADTDGDGTLADEKPVRDFLQGRETFGWTSRGRPTPLAVAANFGGASGAEPVLDLFFDTSGHGTHVAGIAAGNDIYGESALDGVAPGAFLLGLKISDDAQGGITTTGSMLRAVDYAIRFAEARRLPLVLNMSFGVGNEIEGQARIDRLMDSVLAQHPGVVLAVSAGNDGPGLSTLGFPASAGRVLTVGATYPKSFVPGAAPGPDPVAFFSARGGELARPHIVTPGVAYSTVPRWNTGDEVKGGTSMAAPHASGLVALLASGLVQEKRPIDARAIRQALMVTARPSKGGTWLDEGAGLPDVQAALRWLQSGRVVPEIDVRLAGGEGTAAFRARGLASPTDTIQTFELRPGASGAGAYTLRSSAPWLRAPARVAVNGVTRVALRWRAADLRTPGVHTGVVTGWGADTLAGPAFRLVTTVVVPQPAGDVDLGALGLAPNEVRRIHVVSDTARPFEVVARTESGAPGTLFLFEPGGMPYREDNGRPMGSGEEAGGYQVDGHDAVAGVYEIDAVGAAQGPSTVRLSVRRSPVALQFRRERSGIVGTLRNAGRDTVRVEALALLVGAERGHTVVARGSGTERVTFRAPRWAKHVEVDVAMERAQWGRFTDFGVTLFDSAGRQLEQSPLNYAFGRLGAELPEGHGDMALAVGLFPGFADSATAAGGPWTAQVTIRLYAERPVALQPGGEAGAAAGAAAGAGDAAQGPPAAALAVPPGRTVTQGFTLPASLPWALGDGFHPLGILGVRAGEQVWTRRAGLFQPTPPVMR